MPYISDSEWKEHLSKYDSLEKEVKRLAVILKEVKGTSPIIQGYSGKRFDLNENLNVIQLLKRITDIEARVTALE